MEEIKKVFAYAKEYRKKTYLAIILATLSVFSGIIPYYIVYEIINKFITEQSVTIQFLSLMTLLLFAFLSAKSWLFLKAMASSHEAAFDTLMRMRNKLSDKMLSMPMGDIKKMGSGALKNMFVDVIEDMELILAHMIPEGVSYTIAPLVTLIIIALIDWRMALLAMATIPIAIFSMALMMKGNKVKSTTWFKASINMNKRIVEYVGGMEVIKIFNQTTKSFKKYSDSVEDFKKYTLDWYKESWNYMAIFFAIVPCTTFCSVPFGALFYLNGTLTLSNYLLCILLTMALGEPIVKLVRFTESFNTIQKKASSLDYLLKGNELKISSRDLIPENNRVSFENVTFAYEKEEVLKNCTFSADENTVTALVGESGSGKSTLGKLLMRFWDVKNGEIQIGNVNIKDLSFDELMNRVSYVSQDIFLFNTPIIENIRLGNPDASDKDVYRIAKIAQCHDFILNLENGYNTNAGDAGNKLSGGEKQRISIARALLKDSPIIILDEATAFTDPENEDKIQEAINALIVGKTLIVIAHRLSSIKDANNIIVVNEGQIAAQGTHDELLKKSTLYRNSWNAHQEALEWDIHTKEEAKNYAKDYRTNPEACR